MNTKRNQYFHLHRDVAGDHFNATKQETGPYTTPTEEKEERGKKAFWSSLITVIATCVQYRFVFCVFFCKLLGSSAVCLGCVATVVQSPLSFLKNFVSTIHLKNPTKVGKLGSFFFVCFI